MGVYLSVANKDISADEGSGHGLKYFVGEIQGWRKNMEDAHIACTEVADVGHVEREGDMVSLFGVFDGHGGKEVAKFCQVYFQQELVKMTEFYNRDFPTALRKTFHRMDEMLEKEEYDFQLSQFRKLPNPSDKKKDDDASEGSSASGTKTGRKISTSEAMQLFQDLLEKEQNKGEKKVPKAPLASLMPDYVPSFPTDLNTSNAEDEGDKYVNDANMQCRLSEHRLNAGCTAVVALKHGDELYVANAGDSRAVLCRGDGEVYPLSFDHKPSDKIESDRIVKAKGFVNHVGRVNGNLNLSRAIGDLKYKQNKEISPAEQIISGDPDITVTQLLPTDKFIVIACDGIWDCFTNQAVVDFIEERKKEGKSLRAIVEDIFDFSVSVDPRTTQGIGGDNMTCMIIDLQDSS